MKRSLEGLSRRKVMAGLLFCSAAGISAWRQPTERLDLLGTAKLDAIVPDTIGRWKYLTNSGLVVPPEDELSDTLYSQLLTRVYSDGERAPVMLLIAQSAQQTGVLQVHRPEVCYPFGGFEISPITPHHVNIGSRSLRTNSLVASTDAFSESIIYWTRVGDALPPTWAQQRLAVAEQNLRGIVPDAVLFRISTRDNDQRGAQTSLDEFVRAFLGAIPPSKRSIFIV